ncbi:hypothetical protein BHE97_15110 [Aeromicrobium sp. PE09-221]|nr:hypothetical protein BHE97_15110 [Aeromicrobium sp. PE09-221]
MAADDEDRRVTVLIGARLRALRESRGLSMRALAAAAGVSQPFLSQVERGVSAPSMVTTYRLASVLQIAPGDLLPPPQTRGSRVVRAHEGRRLPVVDRPDAAEGRVLVLDEASSLHMVEYRIGADEWVSEWFEARNDTGVYVITGRLHIEIECGDSVELGPRDFIMFGAGTRERWSVVGGDPVHLVLSSVDEVPAS